MSYSLPQLITWAKIAQPLSYRGEKIKQSAGQLCDIDLHIKLYNTRIDAQYAFAQYPGTPETYEIGNYLLTLMGVYLFPAQQAVAGGGSITPILPSLVPNPYDFIVSASSFITTGSSGITFPSTWKGFNMLFVRGHLTQSLINEGGTYYSWDKNTLAFNLLPAGVGGQAAAGEVFQIYPV